MSRKYNIQSPNVIVVKAGGSTAAQWITAGAAVLTLAVVAKTAEVLIEKLNVTNEKIEKAKDVMTLKGIRGRLFKKGK